MGLYDRVSRAWDALLGETRAPAESKPRPQSDLHKLTQQAAGESPRVDKWPVVLGGLMSPENLSVALRLADRGQMRRFCDIASELRETVPQIQTELGKREKAISGCKWTVTAAQTAGLGKRGQKQADKIADAMRARFTAIENLSDAIEHLAGGGIYYGRSGGENIYVRDRDGIGITSINPVDPKRLSYAKNWRVHLWDEAGNERDPRLGSFPGVDIREEWPNKFVIHEPRTLGAMVPTRQGLARVVVWLGVFWKFTARQLMQFNELFANPWRVGIYDRSVDGADIDLLKQELLELSGYTTAVFAKGCEPKFLQVNDTKTHLDSHGIWTGEISKVINGGTLTSQMSGGAGSRAAAEVHEREGAKLTGGDGRGIDATIIRDVMRPLVRLNYGEEASRTACPVFHLVTELDEDISRRTSRIWGFIDRGGRADMNEVREITTGLKEPAKGALIMQPLANAKASAANDAGESKQPHDEGKPADSNADGAQTDELAADDAADEGT